MTDKVRRILCIAAGLVMGIGLIIYGATELLNSKRLAARGKPVQAQVVDAQDQMSGRLRRHTYYLKVSFTTPEAGPVSKRVKVTHETFATAQPGSQVKAFYLAENPTICAAGETVDLRYGNLLLGLVVLGGAVFLLATLNAPSETDKLAQKIEAHLQPMMRERFDYAPVRAQDFAHLDLSFYDDAGRHLLEGVRRFQNELQRTKAEFRRRNGVSKTELERLVKDRAGVDVNALYLSLSARLKQHNVAPA